MRGWDEKSFSIHSRRKSITAHTSSTLSMTKGNSNMGDDNDKSKGRNGGGSGKANNHNKRRYRNKQRNKPQKGFANGSTRVTATENPSSANMNVNVNNANSLSPGREEELLHRITQLEAMVASQSIELRKLREDCRKLTETAETFGEVVSLLRQAGLTVDESSSSNTGSNESGKNSGDNNFDSVNTRKKEGDQIREVESFDDHEIFGTAPSSVTDAADAAGASVLAAILAGKQRMLVDVRDAELTRDLDVLVQFIELTILPVAAGLEGLNTKKNRVKVVFPTVSLLMEYRRTMALAAPEVVSLSTLGLDPVEEKDNLVVVIAPPPDDDEGLAQMNELLTSPSLRQPVIVLNHHMVPLLGPGGDFEPVYHLRLLSVQYMTGDTPPTEWETKAGEKGGNGNPSTERTSGEDFKDVTSLTDLASSDTNQGDISGGETSPEEKGKEDAELEAAMEHAHELGVQQGVTRAMVIRAYPKPWHVFVDTSPDSDADFEVAATFDEYPSQDDINFAIVECLEGSEREDELVAQQMQQALESGQLNAVSDMLGITNIEVDMDPDDDEEDDDDDNYYDDWNPWGSTDTV